MITTQKHDADDDDDDVFRGEMFIHLDDHYNTYSTYLVPCIHKFATLLLHNQYAGCGDKTA